MNNVPVGIFYDLDGTLVDSLPGIEFALARAVANVLPGRIIPSLREKIGPPISQIISSSFDNISEAEVKSVSDNYRLLYDSDGCLRCTAFPGVFETLDFFLDRRILQFVVTNKPIKPTQKVFEKFGFEKFIKGFSCPDSRGPQFLNKAMSTAWLLERHGLAGELCIFVGDSPDDMEAAFANKMRFIGVSYGYASYLLPAGCEQVDKINQLCDLLVRN